MAQQQPIGDASMSQPMPQQDPMMNGTLDPQMGGGDPSMNGGMPDPSMGSEDPNAMGGDPNMGGDPSMSGMEQPMNGGGNIERDRKNIQKNIGKACADFRSYQGQDKEDLGKWIEGMLDSLDGDSDDENIDMNDAPESEEDVMPMECVYTKKDINKKLNEVFGCTDDKKEKPEPQQKKDKPKTKSPFNNPKFN